MESAPSMARQALDVFQQSMNSTDAKIRLQAAHQYLKDVHHPSKQIDMNVHDASAVPAASRDAMDHITDEEMALLNRVVQELENARQADVIEAEVIEENAPGADQGSDGTPA